MKSPCLFILIALSITLFICVRSTEAKDEWIQIRSKNFFLIGNASEKDIRKVGARLEEFRETFRLLFTKMSLTSPIPTNVIVFKNSSSYKQFKPKRADGKIDTFVAGYFQSGEDVNYITLSAEGDDAQTFGVIFHEYVHSIVNTNFGKSEVPPWFSEGLAEYYETFSIENDQKVKLGLPQARHLFLLQQNRLTPLEILFNVSNAQLTNSGEHSRSIFYAESWALMHYLIEGGKNEALGKFLNLLLGGMPPQTAFQNAFQTSYANMENELRNYVSLNQYHYREFTFGQKLNFDTEMRVSPLDEAFVNFYLGDLLAHTHREDEAEPYLLAALKTQPTSSMANTTLAMVKMRQRKFDEARKYLEVAISGDQTNYRALYDYAYLLSRDGRDEFGYVRTLPQETAAKMREALNKAIAINPTYAPSYEMLAFIDLVNNEFLDEAVAHMQKALKIQPGNESYALRLADIYAGQNKYLDASAILTKIAKTTDVTDLRMRAENLLAVLRQRQELEAQRAAERKLKQNSPEPETQFLEPLLRLTTDKPMTEAEIAKANSESKIRSINEMIRQLKPGEQRVMGHLQYIDCRTRPIAFVVKTPMETLTLSSKDFSALELNVFLEAKNKIQVGCDANLSSFNALVTFGPNVASKGSGKELIALEFVPNDFRLMTADELNQPPPRIVALESIDSSGVALSGPPSAEKLASLDKARRDTILDAIKRSLRPPGDGEKRDVGYLDKIECADKAVFFHIRTATQTLRLLDAIPKSRPIQIFAPDLEGTRFDCSLKPVEFPAVFIYLDAPDAKAKTAGSITSLDFVPKSFVLN